MGDQLQTDINIIIALGSLGASVQCLGMSNPAGSAAFGAVALYSYWQHRQGSPNSYAALLLAGAASVFAAESVINSVYAYQKDGLSLEFWRESFKAFGGLGGVAGDVALRFKRDFKSAAGGIKGATIATLRNPAFWYALCGFGIGMSALLAAPGVLTSALLTSSIACCAMSIAVSTQRWLKAAHGVIREEEINNGVSNLWGARALPLLAATFLVGANSDPMLYIAAAGSSILGLKEMLLTRNFNPAIRMSNLFTPTRLHKN